MIFAPVSVTCVSSAFVVVATLIVLNLPRGGAVRLYFYAVS
jgi:hypothetical protein